MPNEIAKLSPASLGGKARAESLTKEERAEIARQAAEARWGITVPRAVNEGALEMAGRRIACAVLSTTKRVLSQGTFLTSIGRSRTPKAGTGGMGIVDGLPFFLAAKNLKPFITEELRASTTPVLYRTKGGARALGYDALLLPGVCEVYLAARDAGALLASQEHIAKRCDLLMRGLARVGIIALVDEATGYQEIRDREALQAILDRFLRQELAAWAKRFPDEFYEQIFRLQGWEWRGMKVNRPRIVAQFTKNIVYARLAPGILKELEAKNPMTEKGYRKAKHHQWLTEDVGHAALAQHLYAVIGFMRASETWRQFMSMLDMAFPKRGDTLALPFMADPE